MTRALRLPLAVSLALLIGAAAWKAGARRPGPEDGSRLVLEHEEGRAKHALSRAAAEAALSRGVSGPPPASVEGTTRGFDVVAYDLSFELDPGVRILSGSSTTRLSGFAKTTDSVTFNLDRAYAVTSVTRDGAPVPGFTFANDLLTVPLTPPLAAEERTSIGIAWSGIPPAAAALAWWDHTTGKAATSVAEPFDSRTYWPCVDAPDDKAVATVTATVPPGYVVASAGLGTSATLPDGRIRSTWRLPQPISTYLVSLNVAKYQVVEDAYRAMDGRIMPIRSYLMPENAAENVPRLSAMKDHISVLASLFGEYPFVDTKYGIVSSWFSGGMEHPTLTSIGENILSNTSRDITLLLVHELAHQWWGDRVTMRTWDDIWLNEGFATYAEVLYQERALGKNPGQTLRTSYDDGLYGGRLAQAVVADPADPFKYTGAVYNKGGWFLHMLRRLVGDDAFFSGLRAYGDAHAWGTATRGELRALFEERTGLDLKQFWDQWLETRFRPTFRATYRTAVDASTVTLAVTQTQGHAVTHPVAGPNDKPYYVFPLTVRITYVDGTFLDVPVTATGATTTLVVPNPSRKFVAGITLDPASDVLKIVESTGPG
ncbi:MAG: M1 family metallopeptidase [Acidobacteria bacterium]|nr:M1 family metallopeptidase [Acidobacteriota bacterium]